MTVSVYSRNFAVGAASTILGLEAWDVAVATSGPFIQPDKTLLKQAVRWTSGMTPAVYVTFTADTAIVYIGGISSAIMGANFFAGALLGIGALPYLNVNIALLQPAQDIITFINTQGGGLPPNVVLCGHSYGGALAEVIAAVMQPALPNQKFQVLTFGSPRAGDGTLAAALGSIPLVRYMNEGDPVPFCPPHFDEAPLGTIALSFANAALLAQYVQPNGGLLLHPDGSVEVATLPAYGPPFADVNLIAWARGNMLFNNEHAIQTYYNRLSVPAYADPPAVLPSTNYFKGAMEVEPPLTLATFNLGPVLGPMAMLAEIAPMQSVYIPPNFRFKWVKVGTYYTVVWMNLTVARGQTKSNARTLAKYGNKLLRVMQTVFSVDHTQLGNALQAYLTVAASSTNGFMPVLTVT